MTALLPRSTTGRLGLVILFLVAAAGGVVAGRAHAWNQSVGGMTAALGGGIVAVGVGGGIMVLALVALTVARLAKAGPGSGVVVLVIIVAGFAVGIGLGVSTAAATGGSYSPPVVIRSSGTTNAAISSPTADFVPRAEGVAECEFGADRILFGVTALDLGELGPGTLRATIALESGVTDVADVELFIDGADADEDEGPAAWSAQGAINGLAGDGSSGTVAFADAPPSVDPKTPNSKPVWDGALSGTVEWSCQPPA